MHCIIFPNEHILSGMNGAAARGDTARCIGQVAMRASQDVLSPHKNVQSRAKKVKLRAAFQ